MLNILLFFQQSAATAANATAQPQEESLIELLSHSTFGLIIMICLFIMSIISLLMLLMEQL